MKVSKINALDEELIDGSSSSWNSVPEVRVALMPSPVGMAEDVSPFMALSEGHGKVEEVRVRAASNGTSLSIRINWDDPDDSQPDDLDEFPDGAAVMFPLGEGANALSMGAKGLPVNAWLWKSDEGEPFDVVAEGYATSDRRDASASGLKASAVHANGHWTLVFQRPLVVEGAFVSFAGGEEIGIAFAIWEGANKERVGQKSVSGDFVILEGLE
jgi:DMSO reductase family type II enzyme heme b subunit